MAVFPSFNEIHSPLPVRVASRNAGAKVRRFSDFSHLAPYFIGSLEVWNLES
ncbi:hypothetical protein Hsw_4124 [Hymenobacter swuensis DY53]|uniref:Uncharacterized protein n=1 Tax=Hymenobacter swuensis DY53 TaxID=1227739 RepID=W8F2U8_9BACT|nr:hypothetical protein Hsw_4124 [Hymenobacter swuensis DY53]